MAATGYPIRQATSGEIGGMVLAAASVLRLLMIEVMTSDPAYAFHITLFAAAATATVFLIANRCFRPGAVPAPLEIDGRPNYNMEPVKFATVAAMFWGIAGFTIGLVIALQLAFPDLNFDLPWINFGRLRPLHTSAVIFAFGGNVLIGTSFYVVQRTSHARLAGDLSPWFVVLGYNLFIVVAGTG